MKTKITLEQIKEHLEFRSKLNKLNLEDMEITENGIPIEITKKCLDRFNITRLNNMDFFEMRFWVR